MSNTNLSNYSIPGKTQRFRQLLRELGYDKMPGLIPDPIPDQQFNWQHIIPPTMIYDDIDLNLVEEIISRQSK